MPPTRPFTLRSRLLSSAVRLSVTHPGRVLALWGAICVLATPGLLQVRIEASTESILDRTAPAWSVYQESLDTFGGDEIVVVALEGTRPYDATLVETIETLSDHFETLEGVRRVDSLTTQPVIRLDARGDLDLTPATRGAGLEARAPPRVVEQRAETDRILPDTLVSRDGGVFAINLVLDRDPVPHYDGILDAVATALAGVDGQHGQVWVSGVPVFQRETSRQTRRELLALAPLTLLVIGGLLALVFRSGWAVVALLGSGAVGNLIMLASIGALGIPVSFTMVILPPIVLALAAAYGMHVLTAAARAAEEAPASRADLARHIGEVAAPIALSGSTTAIGFAATSIAGIETVRNVGTFGGIGVLAVLLLTLTALPALLALLPLRRGTPRGFAWLEGRAAPQVAHLTSRHPRAITRVWLLLAGVAALGTTQVAIDTDATRWFRHGTETRDDYEAIREALSGISPINLMVDAQGGSVLASEVLTSIDALATHLEARPEVGKAVSIADPLRQLHASFGAPTGPLPRDAAAAQYLLLLESVEQIEDLVTDDRTQANVLLRLDDNGSTQILAVAAEAERWWREHAPPGTEIRPTGVMYEFARAQDAIAWGQIVGLGAALCAIAVVLLLIFRAPIAAAITIAPNLIPLLGVYGAMGFLGVPLDAGTVLVGSLAIGIAVDDTIHLATAFFRNASADDPQAALGRALRHVLPAVSYTTAIVGLGFLVLAFSDFTFVRNLGVLMTSVMAVCLLADVYLLPALLLSRRPRTTPDPVQ